MAKMRRIPYLLAHSSLLILIGCGSDSPSASALKSFRQGDYLEAQELLNDSAQKISPGQRFLETGYILRELDQLPDSTAAFRMAAEQVHQLQRPDLQLEIYYNLALNAYLENDISAFEEIMRQISEIGPNKPWSLFFNGLHRFSTGNYAEAKELLEATKEKLPLSPWLKEAHRIHFSDEAMALILARIEIELGQYVEARQNLSQLLNTANAEQKNAIQYINALSYLREAEERSPTAAIPYYRLALSQLHKLPQTDPQRTTLEDKISKDFIQNTFSLLKGSRNEEAHFYLSTLQNLGSQEAFIQIAAGVQQAIQEAIQAGQWETALSLSEVTPFLDPGLQKPFEEIAQKLVLSTLNDIQAETFHQIHRKTTLSKQLSGDKGGIEKQFASAFTDLLLNTIKQDSADLEKTQKLLKAWDSLEMNNAFQIVLYEQLLDRAEMLWFKQQTIKGLAILKIIGNQNLVKNRELIEPLVQERIERLYGTARKSGDINQILAILALIEDLELKSIELPIDQELVLSHAESLLRQNSENEALKLAKWVHQIHPENQRAQKLLGIILFDQAKYEEALSYLDPPGNNRELIAFTVAKVIQNPDNENEWLLKEVAEEIPLDERIFFRIALGLLAKGKLNEGTRWLESVSRTDPEAQVARSYTAFVNGQWEKALLEWQKLPLPFQALGSVRGLAIQSLLELNREKEAESLMFTKLEIPNASIPYSFSNPFLQFQEMALDQFQFNLLIGRFLLENKKAPYDALEYLQSIDSPSPESDLLKGKALAATGRYNESILYLTRVAEQPDEKTLIQEAIPLLIRSLTQIGHKFQAYEWYKIYFKQFPESTELTLPYAQLLQEFLRYDLAVKEYEILKTKDALPESAIPDYIASLIHGENEKLALSEAIRVLKASPPLTIQLEIARWMALIDRLNAVKSYLAPITDLNTLSPSQAEALLTLNLQTASYGKAQALIDTKKDVFKSSLEGLILLSTFYDRLSQSGRALEYAQLAAAQAPDDEVLAFQLESLTHALESAESRVTKIDQRFQKQSPTPADKMEFAEATAHLHDLVKSANQSEVQIVNIDSYLRRAANMMKQMGKEFPQLPQIFYLHGKLLFALELFDEAIPLLKRAVHLSPTYAEPHFLLGNIYESQGTSSQAAREYLMGLMYQPDASDVWLKLGKLFYNEGYFAEAAQHIRQGLRIRPNSISLHVELAKTLLALNNPEEARAILETAHRLAPKNTEILTLLLTTLYDAVLFINAKNPKELLIEQRKIYKQLSELDPLTAKELLGKLKKQRDELLNFEFPTSNER